MGIEHPGNSERFMPDMEKLSEAERALEFARRFGVDFECEQEASIAAAPVYLRGMITELRTDSNVAWVHGNKGGKTGVMTHAYVDKSWMEVYIAYTPRVLTEYGDPMLRLSEIYIDMFAEVNDRIERRIAYVLGHEKGAAVIRTETDLTASDEDGTGEGRDIVQMRAIDEDFMQMSDDRELYERRAIERLLGFNEQPIGIGELIQLRQAILTGRF